MSGSKVRAEKPSEMEGYDDQGSHKHRSYSCGDVCNSRETHTWALLNSKMERYEDQGRHKIRSYSTVTRRGVQIKGDTYLGPAKQ